MARLIDSYAEGLIEKDEFEPRVGRLRQRIRALEEHAQRYADEAVVRGELQVIVGRLEEFAARVREGLAEADWQLRREMIRTLVKRIDVTPSTIDVVFRITPTTLGPHAPSDTLQDCWPRLGMAFGKGGVGHSGRFLRDRANRIGSQRHGYCSFHGRRPLIPSARPLPLTLSHPAPRLSQQHQHRLQVEVSRRTARSPGEGLRTMPLT